MSQTADHTTVEEKRLATNDKSWKEIAARWLFGQDVTTVLLVGILVSLWYFGWYAMTVAVPAHLGSIQTGYERIDAKHEAAYKTQREDHAELVKYIIDGLKEVRRTP